MELTIEDLKLFLDNMYDQLDTDQIDTWPVDGLEVYVGDKVFVLNVFESKN